MDTIKELKEILESKPSIKESYIKSHMLQLYNDIYKINVVDNFREKLFLYINGINEIGKCLECDKKTKFLSYNRGYRIYYSKKCSNNNKDLQEKILITYKETNIKKYGVEKFKNNQK